MCGIVALVSDRIDEAGEAVRAMVGSLRHRGPDGTGILPLHGCQLGHTRLSIIDPTGGSQPMSDDTGRYHITFNGEIYNFRELRAELEQAGNVFHTQSDTETLLLAYRQWGDAAVARLNGQFAFVVWDLQQRRLFAARDRLGEKPLYFAETARGELLVASEIKALLASGLIDPVLDGRAIEAYLWLNYVPPCLTIYENVQTLEPGQAMAWQQGQRHCWNYWAPRLATSDIDTAEAAAEVRRLLSAAVRRQMVADTTVGAFLSGGLDSSTIVGLMSPLSSRPVKTFAAGFGDLIDELPYARLVAGQYGTEHAEKQMRIDVAEQLENMSAVYDEPFGDSSNIPTYLLSQFARRDVKVVLSGDGGDELFGGYSWYQPLLGHDALPSSWSELWLRRLEAKSCGALSALGLPLKARREAARAIYRGVRDKRAHPDLWQRHVANLDSLPGMARRQRNGAEGSPVMQWLAAWYRPDDAVRGIDRAVDFDLRCYLPGDILVKVDRAAMAHGLETRSPFLDTELVEFVLSLPARVRFEHGKLKSLLRQACQDLWPAAVSQRGKQGFGAPLTDWLQQPRVQTLRQRIFQPGSPLLAVLPAAQSLRAAAARRPQAEWNLLCLGLWLESHSACLSRLKSAA